MLVDSGDKVKELAALVIRQQLQEIGVKLTFERINFPKLLNEYLISGKFKMVLIQFNAGADPGTASVFWHSRNIGKYNVAGYKNIQVDSLFDLGSVTTDQKKRQNIYRQLHAVIAADQPATFLFFKNRFEAVNRRIAGVKSGGGFNIYQSIKQWYIVPQPDRRVAME